MPDELCHSSQQPSMGKPNTQSLSGQSQWEQDVLVLLPWTDSMSYFGARLLMGHECLLNS